MPSVDAMRSVASAAAVALLASTCGSEHELDAGLASDAGMIRIDAPSTSPDAGPDPSDARVPRPLNEWLDVPGLDGCVQVASAPTGVLPRLPTRDCPGEPRPCREVDVTWSVEERIRFRVEDSGHFSTGGAIAFERVEAGVRELLVVREDGAVEAAFRVPQVLDRTCGLGPAALTERWIVFSVEHYESDGAVRPPRVVLASRDDPTSARVLKAFTPEEECCNISQEIEANEEVIGYEIVGGNIWRLDYDGNATLVGGGRLGESQASLDEVWGDAVYYTTGPGPAPLSIRRATADGVETVVAPDGAEAAFLRTDGELAAWFEMIGVHRDLTSWDEVTMWTGGFAPGAPPTGARAAFRVDNPSPYSAHLVGGGVLGFVGGTDVPFRIHGPDGSVLDSFPARGDHEFYDPDTSYITSEVYGLAIKRRGHHTHLTFQWIDR